MATNMTEHMLEMIQNKGWLAIDSLYFDNGLVVNISSCKGRIAIVKSINSLVSLTTIDMCDTELLDNGITKHYHANLSHGQALTVTDLAGLQRYNLAMYIKTNSIVGGKPIHFPDKIANATSKLTYVADLEALVDGELELGENGKDGKIDVESIFTDSSIEMMDKAWFNIDYLKTVWFKNKFDFNDKLQAYLGLADGDII